MDWESRGWLARRLEQFASLEFPINAKWPCVGREIGISEWSCGASFLHFASACESWGSWWDGEKLPPGPHVRPESVCLPNWRLFYTRRRAARQAPLEGRDGWSWRFNGPLMDAPAPSLDGANQAQARHLDFPFRIVNGRQVHTDIREGIHLFLHAENLAGGSWTNLLKRGRPLAMNLTSSRTLSSSVIQCSRRLLVLTFAFLLLFSF